MQYLHPMHPHCTRCIPVRTVQMHPMHPHPIRGCTGCTGAMAQRCCRGWPEYVADSLPPKHPGGVPFATTVLDPEGA
jgi:hypothetical protein